MIEHYIRPTYQKIMVDPSAVFLSKLTTANTITYLACVSGILIAPLLIMGNIFTAFVMLLVTGYLDTLDGTIARLTSKSSQKGTVLDIVSDRVVEFFIIIGLFGIDPNNRGWLAIFMLGSILVCITTFLVVAIFIENSSNKGFYYSQALIERAEAFIFFAFMIFFPQYFNQLAWLFIFLVLLTSYQHYYRFIKMLK